MKQKSEERLYEIAAAQAGYFTARQANEAGIIYTNHPYYAKTGAWIKEWRGIYRLARFPEPDDGHYTLWSLWSCNRKGEIQGVYSHETALSIFEISDVNPSKLHMTVPPGFRKTAQTPEILVLYKKKLSPDMCEQRTGYSVLKPVPNILMLIEEGKSSDEIIIQALRDGITKGYMLKNQMMSLKLSNETREHLNNLLKQI